MAKCYNCGKLILTKKVMGLIGNKMEVFCSERCRNAAWHSLNGKNEGISESGNVPSISLKSSGQSAPESVSSFLILGSEFEYSAKTDGITITVGKLENKSSWQTGKIRLELFFSKDGPYKTGGKVSGTTIAVSNEYAPLKKNYSYFNMKTQAKLYDRPKPGLYTPILFVKELCSDEKWHIAGFVNFPSKHKWS